MAESDEIELDDPIRETLPQFRLANEAAAEAITLRDLLCHRPGLNCPAAVFLDAFTGEITDERFFALLARERPTGRCAYSNTHFTLAARVAEAVRGTPWQELLETELLAPAGMTRTTARASVAYADPNCAWPLVRTPAGWNRQRVKSDQTMHAAGGICTTPRDALRWLALFLDRGRGSDGTAIVAPETIEDALTLQQANRTKGEEIPGGAVDGFGLAWMLGRWHGRRLAMHGDDYLGYSSAMVFLPDDGIGVAVMDNSGAQGVVLAMVDELLARLTGVKSRNRLGWIAARAEPPVVPRTAPSGATAPELGLPLDHFTGRYAHELMGVLELQDLGGRLVGGFSEYRCVVSPAAPPDAGALQLRFDGGDDISLARPEWAADGRMAALTIAFFDGEWRLERQK